MGRTEGQAGMFSDREFFTAKANLYSAKESKDPWEDKKRDPFGFVPKPLTPSEQPIYISRSKSRENAATNSKSSTRLVREMVGRKASGENLNKSSSEVSLKPNKPLVALVGSNLSTAAKPPTVPTTLLTDKKTKQQDIDNFFKKNYGVSANK